MPAKKTKTPAKKTSSKATKATQKPTPKAAKTPAVVKVSSAGSKTPPQVNQILNNFFNYAEKNPMPTVVGIIAVALGIMLIFG